MAGTQYDLVGKHGLVKGFPWSLSLTLRQNVHGPARDLTGCTADLLIYDALQPGAAPTTFGSDNTLGADGAIRFALSEEATTLAPDRARYRIVLTDSLGTAGLYLFGRLGVTGG